MEKNENTNEIDLRYLLKLEYAKRIKDNPRLSLRSMASKIDIDQSLLSKILRGKRNLTPETTKKVLNFLGMYTPDTDSARHSQLRNDEFEVLSTWYHFAIVELLKTSPAPRSYKLIAQRLQITEVEAELATQRLERLNFIKWNKNHWVVLKNNYTWFDGTSTTVAKKNLQKALHSKSVAAIDDVPFEKRDHSTLVVAIDPQLIPEIRKKITEFRRSLDKFIEEKGNVKSVYTLCVSIFPLEDTER